MIAMNEISKRIFLLNIILSQVIVSGVGLLLIFTILKDVRLTNLFKFAFSTQALVVVLVGSSSLILLQVIIHKFVTSDRLFDELNLVLMNKFDLRELFFIFLGGSIAEEFLFRGLLQPELGIWLTSILFVIIHFRYYKRFYILAEVFLMGVILGFTYAITSLLWVPIVCHFLVNYLTAVLIKKGYIKLEGEST